MVTALVLVEVVGRRTAHSFIETETEYFAEAVLKCRGFFAVAASIGGTAKVLSFVSRSPVNDLVTVDARPSGPE